MSTVSPGEQDHRTDLQLIAAINDGDAEAFEALYRRYRDWVAALARRFAGNETDALDVLQDTFAYVLRKFPGFRLTASFTTFLYPVVRNLSIAASRKRGRFASGDAQLDQVPAAPANRPDLGDLGIVLATLSDVHREVLLMRFVDDLSLEEIASALRIPAGTVKSRLHNALETLRSDPRTRRLMDD